MADEESAIEVEARADGWVPQDEWKGPEEKWRPAEEFVEVGKNINGILNKKVERLESRVNELLTSNREISEFAKKTQAKDRQESERLIGELEGLRQQAVTDGDGEAFQRAESQIHDLRSEPSAPQENPTTAQWLQGNQWYGADRKLSAYADGISDQLRSQGYNDQSPAYFEELTRQVKETFPDDFGNPNRSRSNGVETGGQEVVVSDDKSFDNLPADAKAQYERFARDIEGFTKEQYVEQYDWTDS